MLSFYFINITFLPFDSVSIFSEGMKPIPLFCLLFKLSGTQVYALKIFGLFYGFNGHFPYE